MKTIGTPPQVIEETLFCAERRVRPALIHQKAGPAVFADASAGTAVL